MSRSVGRISLRVRLLGMAVAILVGAAPVAAQDSLRTVTLEEAVALALESSPAAVAAAGTESTARAELRQARAAWLPSVTLNSGYANSSNERFDQTTGQLVSQSFTTQLAASYELFDGGRRLTQQRSAAAEVRAATAGYRAQRFQTILAAERIFFEAAAAAELVGSAQQRLERARQQLSFAQTRLELGTATRSDVLRAELEVGNAELALLDTESGLRSSRLALGRQIGTDDQVQPAAGALASEAPELPPIEVIAARAEQVSPTAVSARADWSARRSDIWSAYSAYIPTLRATGGYDWFSYQFPARDQSWSLRLTASIPLFNGLARETNVARARAAERLAEAQARDAAIGARIAAEDAAREIQSAERRVEIAGRAVELAREDLRVQEERYQLGNATILDLQTSQVTLTEAEVAWVRARQTLATAIGQLEAVLGETIGQLRDAQEQE